MAKDTITHLSFTEDLSRLLLLTPSITCAFTMDPFAPDDKAVSLPNYSLATAEYVPQNKRFILAVRRTNPMQAFMYDMYNGGVPECYDTEAPVLAVGISGFHVVLKTLSSVVIYHVDNPAPPLTLPCFSGEERALAISKVVPGPGEAHFFVAFPGQAQGTVAVAKCLASAATLESKGAEKDAFITCTASAHDGHVSSLAISEDGTLVASASEKGTSIRVFKVDANSSNEAPQVIERAGVHREFYRGYKHCAIAGMRISPNNEMLAVLSVNGTCHLYGLTDNITNYWKFSSPNSVSSYCNIDCGATDTGEIRFTSDSKIMYVACSNGRCLRFGLKVDASKHIVATELASIPIKIL